MRRGQRKKRRGGGRGGEGEKRRGRGGGGGEVRGRKKERRGGAGEGRGRGGNRGGGGEEEGGEGGGARGGGGGEVRKHQAELSAGSHDLSADQAVTQPRRVPHHAAGPGPGQNGQTSAPLGTRDMHPAVRLQGSPLQSSLHRNCSFPLSGRPPASTPPTGSCRRTRPCHSLATWPDAS